MEMILEFHGMLHWVAVLALLAVTRTALVEKRVMISQIKLFQRSAAEMLLLVIALRFQTPSGVVQTLTQIKLLQRICVLAKILHAAQYP